MPISYFGEKQSWLNISREERLFCAHLYFDILGHEKDFIKFLNKATDLNLNPDQHWEVGYEVCFYRDMLHWQGGSAKQHEEQSPKRTFDLCLFSEDAIIVIEAKAQQFFRREQVKEFQKDRGNIRKVIGREIEVYLIALCTSGYQERSKSGILDKFDATISWKEMAKYFKNTFYLKADEVK